MSSDQRTSTAFPSLRSAHMAAFMLCLGLAGCSADVTRFDGPSFGLTDDKAPAPQSSGPPYRRSGLTGEGTDGVPPPPGRMASLPPPNPGYGSEPLPPPSQPPSYDARPAERRPYRPASAGETIEVQAGDTLYGLARRHHVSANALSEANNLGATATIKPGQKLVLPAGAQSTASASDTGRSAPAKLPVAKAPRAPEPETATAPMPNWEGRHTLRSGESLYAVARQYGVTQAEVQRVNEIADPGKLRAGTVLKVPASQPGALAAREALTPPPRAGQQPSAADPATPSGITPGVRMLNQPERKASLTDRANDADTSPAYEPPATAQSVRFPWPARGKVIGNFGRNADGSPNEGVKIQMPMGTDVRAIDSGRVLYASSEVQAYGNLVVIQHDNGFVSVYGHADRLLVKYDETVRKGQVIAKSGKSGLADQPQLHFELRQGNKPVDPVAYLER